MEATDETRKQAKQGNNIMTVGETAEYLRVHPSTIYRLLQQGKIPAFKVGSDWRFSRAAIDRWCLAQLEPKQ
jgi:excisionase family DNA binding protein